MNKAFKFILIPLVVVAGLIIASVKVKAMAPPPGGHIFLFAKPSYKVTNTFSNFTTSAAQVGSMPISGSASVAGSLNGTVASWDLGKRDTGVTGGSGIVTGNGPSTGCATATANLYAGSSSVATDTATSCVSAYTMTIDPSLVDARRNDLATANVTITSSTYTGTLALSFANVSAGGFSSYILKDPGTGATITSLNFTAEGQSKVLRLEARVSNTANENNTTYSLSIRAHDNNNVATDQIRPFSVRVVPPLLGATCTITANPTVLAPSGTTNISVTMRNTGSTTWTANTTYKMQYGSTGNGLSVSPSDHAITADVAYNGTVQFNLTKTVPSTSVPVGTENSYTLTATMYNGVASFGTPCTTVVKVTPTGGTSGSQLRVTGDVYSKESMGNLVCDGVNSIAVSGGDPSKASGCQYNIKSYSPVLEWSQDESIPWRNKEMNENVENLKKIAKPYTELEQLIITSSGNINVPSHIPEGAVYYSSSDITLTNINSWNGVNTTIISDGTISISGNFRSSDSNQITVGLIAKNGITIRSDNAVTKHVALFTPGAVAIEGTGDFTLDGLIATHTLNTQRTGTTQINYDPLFIKTPPPGFTQSLLPSWE